MSVLGYNGGGAFIESVSNAGDTAAIKATSPAAFTPITFGCNFDEAWGVSGTAYFAIYSDNAGTPGTKLWDGSETYSSGHGGWLYHTMSSPPALSNSTVYWLASHFENDSGSFNIQYSEDSETGWEFKKWTETVGSWTNDPTIDSTTSNSRLRMFVTDEVDVDDERDAKISGVDTDNSTRSAKIEGTGDVLDSRSAKIIGEQDTTSVRSAAIYGDDGRYVENFSSTTKKDAGNTTANWTTDGVAEMVGA